MQVPTLVIGGRPTSFAAVWVHLKPVAFQPLAFEARVPSFLWQAIFDPGAMRPESVAWARFVESEIGDLGSFILESYFRTMSAVAQESPARWEWVVANVIGVREDGDSFCIDGWAERFEPSRFV